MPNTKYTHLRSVSKDLPKCGMVTRENLTSEIQEATCKCCLRIKATPESIARLFELDQRIQARAAAKGRKVPNDGARQVKRFTSSRFLQEYPD